MSEHRRTDDPAAADIALRADSAPDTEKAAGTGAGQAAGEAAGQQAVAFIAEHQFQGPLPPPSWLSGYEDVLPGAAERILTMAEKEQDHRHACDHDIIKSSTRRALTGQVMAFLIALAALGLAGFLLYTGKSVGGLTSLILGLGTLVGVFVYNKSQSSGSPGDSSPPAEPPEG